MQFRRYQKFSILNKLRYFKYKWKLKFCGKNVWFDNNVKFLRFTSSISIDDNVVTQIIIYEQNDKGNRFS